MDSESCEMIGEFLQEALDGTQVELPEGATFETIAWTFELIKQLIQAHPFLLRYRHPHSAKTLFFILASAGDLEAFKWFEAHFRQYYKSEARELASIPAPVQENLAEILAKPTFSESLVEAVATGGAAAGQGLRMDSASCLLTGIQKRYTQLEDSMRLLMSRLNGRNVLHQVVEDGNQTMAGYLAETFPWLIGSRIDAECNASPLYQALSTGQTDCLLAMLRPLGYVDEFGQLEPASFGHQWPAGASAALAHSSTKGWESAVMLFPEALSPYLIGLRNADSSAFSFQNLERMLSAGIPLNYLIALDAQNNQSLADPLSRYQTILTECNTESPETANILEKAIFQHWYLDYQQPVVHVFAKTNGLKSLIQLDYSFQGLELSHYLDDDYYSAAKLIQVIHQHIRMREGLDQAELAECIADSNDAMAAAMSDFFASDAMVKAMKDFFTSQKVPLKADTAGGAAAETPATEPKRDSSTSVALKAPEAIEIILRTLAKEAAKSQATVQQDVFWWAAAQFYFLGMNVYSQSFYPFELTDSCIKFIRQLLDIPSKQFYRLSEHTQLICLDALKHCQTVLSRYPKSSLSFYGVHDLKDTAWPLVSSFKLMDVEKALSRLRPLVSLSFLVDFTNTPPGEKDFDRAVLEWGKASNSTKRGISHPWQQLPWSHFPSRASLEHLSRQQLPGIDEGAQEAHPADPTVLSEMKGVGLLQFQRFMQTHVHQMKVTQPTEVPEPVACSGAGEAAFRAP